jgi:signal transduction histidine kinase
VRGALADVAQRRRAHAASVRVRVDDHLTISIDDDGPEPDATATSSTHLAGLAARAHALGGTTEVRSRDGGGRQVRWSVPLRG